MELLGDIIGRHPSIAAGARMLAGAMLAIRRETGERSMQARMLYVFVHDSCSLCSAHAQTPRLSASSV